MSTSSKKCTPGCHMDLFLGFVKVVLLFLPFAKQNQAEDFKSCWSFCLELNECQSTQCLGSVVPLAMFKWHPYMSAMPSCICICICICKPYLVISLHNRLPGTLCTELFLGSAYFIIQNIFLAPLQHLPSYLLYCGYSKKISTYSGYSKKT